jgi:hypothetical protein
VQGISDQCTLASTDPCTHFRTKRHSYHLANTRSLFHSNRLTNPYTIGLTNNGAIFNANWLAQYKPKRVSHTSTDFFAHTRANLTPMPSWEACEAG